MKYSIILLSGLFLGWLLFHPRHHHETKSEVLKENPRQSIWTCAMHPQIRMQQPGKCPICGMDLIPLEQGGSQAEDSDAVHLTAEAAQLANVMTAVVSKQIPLKEVRLYGKVEVDERLLQSQVAHIAGRIENLRVSFTGESVFSGQVLGQIYSPDLVTAQQELLIAARARTSQPEIYEAAREKLLQWKLTEGQISAIESSGKVQNSFDILSTSSGVVLSRKVNRGDYVSQGTVLFEISDLSKIWIMFDAYENDLPYIKNGENVTFTLQALPGETYSGKVTFIDPVIDPVTRIARVRVETGNRSGKLKPGMFATGTLISVPDGYGETIVIPKSSVLWTGKRSIVYIKQPGLSEFVYRMREIELGPMLGDSYVVQSGLNVGEEIVVRGTFSVDAAAQLEGKQSMMNPSGGGKSSSMPGMIMPGESGSDDSSMPGMNMSNDGKTKDDTQNGKTVSGEADQINKTSVSMEFVMQLNEVFDRYIELKNALVGDRVKDIPLASEKVLEALNKIDKKLLTGDMDMKWMDVSVKLNEQLNHIISAKSIETKRAGFSSFSDLFYKTVKTFGLMGKTVYYQFCPMANDGKGAYWLSETKEIRNPYFGESMLTCGETKETLNF